MSEQPIRRGLGFLAGFVALFFLATLSASLFMRAGSSGGVLGGPVIAVVPLEGEIVRSRDFVETMGDLSDDDDVAAIVVRIDSPGGQVAPSQEMYGAMRVAREKKPVVASLGSTAASGGYYVAAAADSIVANPGSLTGSVGVIWMLADFSGLLEKVGVKPQVITAGGLKDMGSSFRPLTARERKLFQEMADEVQNQFLRDVAAGRGIEVEDARSRMADGRVMTGEEAHRVGLVDQLGGLDRAIEVAMERAGLEGEPSIRQIIPTRVPWWLRAAMSEDVRAPTSVFELLGQWATRRADEPKLLWRLPFASDGFRS